MNWNDYRKQQDSARFDPAFSRRVLDAASSEQYERKEPIMMKHTKNFARMGLIAAVLTLVIAVSAFASFFTSWDAVRAHLGLGREETIPEYVEYTDQASNNLTLISTLRTAEGMTIYAEASPIQIERTNKTLSGLNLDKEVFGRISHAQYFGTTVLSYDKERQTALLEITVTTFDMPLNSLDSVEVEVELRNWKTVEATYGPLTVPVSKDPARTAVFDIPFDTEMGRGHLTSALLASTSIRVHYSFPAYSSWENYVPYDDEKAEQGDEEWGLAFSDADREYSQAWIKGAAAVLADARLEFADGSSVLITDLEPAIFNVWYPFPYLSIEDFDSFSSMYYTKKPLDLRTVTGITIADTTYPLNPVN